MFPILGLFQRLPCPERPQCNRLNCIFSHNPDVVTPPTSPIPVDVHTPTSTPTPRATSAPAPVASTSKVQVNPTTSIPAKRYVNTQLRNTDTSNGNTASEPPRKLQKTGTLHRPNAVPTATHTSSGTPVLRVNAAQSQVAVPVRQAMLKNLYDHFVILYQDISAADPTLAAEHALRQEEEVYKQTNKLTYRNGVISSIASLKRRPKPDAISHPSVGTESDIAAREEARKKMESLRLSKEHLEPYILSLEQMKSWNYIVEIPMGVGGDRPSEEGFVKKCERCNQYFKVKRKDEADECIFHWGRPFTRVTNGEKRRLYSCCSRSMNGEGCERGPHVFYETDPEELHRRHAFSSTRVAAGSSQSGAADTALDIVALDCEMIYTTGGSRVARVSVVDSTGAEIFDELVRMDEGVEIIDFNTRFSGITPEAYASAVLPLTAVRKSLDAFINSNTIIIGHALENDLKTLRMIHHRCVDTVAMFPHKAGPPYRRALRDLVKEHLGRTIQKGGGTVGHSSLEDSIATLDLVRWHVVNGRKPPNKPTANL